MPMDENEITRLIKKNLPDAEVSVRDLAGDGVHYAASVVSEAFRAAAPARLRGAGGQYGRRASRAGPANLSSGPEEGLN